jgi:hypothetical protein
VEGEENGVKGGFTLRHPPLALFSPFAVHVGDMVAVASSPENDRFHSLLRFKWDIFLHLAL